MVSTAANFKSRARKEITLPSGETVEIRRLSAIDFIGLGELPLPEGNGADETPEEKARRLKERLDAILKDPDRINRYSNRAVVKGVVRPRFSDKDEDLDNPNVVHVRDLDETDLAALVKGIMEFSGLSKEAGQTAESFRADGEPRPGGRSGDEIRETAD